MQFMAISNLDCTREELVQAIDDALVRVYNKGIEDGILNLPNVIFSVLKDQHNFAAMREQFLAENKDLIKGREAEFGEILGHMEEDHVGKPYMEILRLATEEFNRAHNSVNFNMDQDPGGLGQVLMELSNENPGDAGGDS